MIQDIYPVKKYPFEELLLKNNYKLNKETYKMFIHEKYCIHISKKNELCRRKKIPGKNFCGRHAPNNVSFLNKCIYNNCKRTIKKNKLCPIHKKYMDRICNTSLPEPDIEELKFFGHNIYDYKIYKGTKIIIKDYIFDGHFSDNRENKIMKYSYFA